MKIKTYPRVCPSCKGSGFIENPQPVSSQITIVCPACQGNKIVTVTETDFSNPVQYDILPISPPPRWTLNQTPDETIETF